MYRTQPRPIKSDQTCADAPEEEYDSRLKALSLPEILTKIFSHLDAQSKGRAAQVAWLWHEIFELPQVWSDVTVTLEYNEKEPSRYMITPFPNQYVILEIMNLFSSNTTTVTQPYSRSFPMVTKLIICNTYYSITDNTINLVVQRFKNLVTLKLRNHLGHRMTDTTMTLIVENLKLLKHLDLRDCVGLTEIGYATLCGWNGVMCQKSVPALHSLSLSDIFNLTDGALKYLSIGQPALRNLNLNLGQPCYVPNHPDRHRFMYHGINDSWIIHLKHMANLTDLDLSESRITSVGLELLASGSSQLTALTLDFCCWVDDKCGKPLALMIHLTKLSLCGTKIGDMVLQCLANGAGASAIDTLYLMYCHNLTIKAGQHLARLVNLRVVNLTNSPFSDAGLIHLASVPGSRIEILSISRQFHVTDAGISHVACLPLLQELHLCWQNYSPENADFLYTHSYVRSIRDVKLYKVTGCVCEESSLRDFRSYYVCATFVSRVILKL